MEAKKTRIAFHIQFYLHNITLLTFILTHGLKLGLNQYEHVNVSTMVIISRTQSFIASMYDDFQMRA